jgi:NADP-dependent 3-hydroxy acid dehydrogenase YdfG
MGDLAVEEDCQLTVKKTIEHFDRLDVLVANAGLMDSKSVETITMKDYDRIMNINCRSVLYQIQLAVPHLIQTKGNVITVQVWQV